MATESDQGCVKCGHTEIEEGTLSATGSGLSKVFDLQHNNFTTITCKNCGYTLSICSLEDSKYKKCLNDRQTV